MVWAPIAIAAPAVAVSAVSRSMAGGQMRMSRSWTPATAGAKPAKNSPVGGRGHLAGGRPRDRLARHHDVARQDQLAARLPGGGQRLGGDGDLVAVALGQADAVALGGEEGVGHGAADEDRVGGAMANAFLAAKGYGIGLSKGDGDQVAVAAEG